jgi:hypothetical protein
MKENRKETNDDNKIMKEKARKIKTAREKRRK